MNNASGHLVILAGAGLAAAFLSAYMLAAKQSEPAADETVVVLPQRAQPPAPQSAARPPAERPSPAVGPGPMSDPAGLARTLQRELKRVGCYEGEPNGVWNPASRAAMKAFIERVNASLPVDRPDPVLLALLQSHQGRACGEGCPSGEAEGADGRCLPAAIIGKASKPAPVQADSGSRVEPTKAEPASVPMPVPVPVPAQRRPVAVAPSEPPPRAAAAPPVPVPAPAPVSPRADVTTEPDEEASRSPRRRSAEPVPATRVYGRSIRRSIRRAPSKPAAYARSLLRSIARAAQPW
jgi:hypothetical protein